MSQLFEHDQLYNGVNRRITKSLFKEVAPWDRMHMVVMSLKSNSKDLPSLRDMYLELCLDDPTETTFAEYVFGDLEFWYEIKSSTWFKPFYEEYVKTVTLKRKSQAFKFLAQEVREQGKGALQAAKYLIEEPWKAKTGTPADKRKARKEAQETTQQAFEEAGISEDVQRLKEEGLLN